MIYEEYKLWEILIPSWNDNDHFNNWYKSLDVSGMTVMAPNDGYWYNTIETVQTIRIACSEEKIKEIAELTAKYFSERAVMFYLVSNKCYIGISE